jgi:uncharacterized protein
MVRYSRLSPERFKLFAGRIEMGKILGTVLFGLLLTASSCVAIAGPFEDAGVAYIRRDYTTALRLFRPLAEQGNVGAQQVVGFMYARGQGVAKDDREALKWYRLAAQQGNVGAQVELGFIYVQGRGVAQDYPEAANGFG